MTPLVLAIIVLVIIIIYVDARLACGEGFNDQCIMRDNGDTDAIKQERLRGLRNYMRSGSAPEKKSLSGGGLLTNIDTGVVPTAPDVDAVITKEQLQDFATSSAEDAAGRMGGLDNINYGWTNTPTIGPQWSSEQLYREYAGDLCRGDQRLAEKMRDVGMRAQQSSLNRATYHRQSLEPFVHEELTANENSIWWDDDQDLEQEMQKDGHSVDAWICRNDP